MTAAIVETENTVCDADSALDRLAHEIRREHEAVGFQLQGAIAHARVAGEKLEEVKRQLGHGRFMRWVETNCGFSHATANLYMNVAKAVQRAEEAGDSECVKNLSLRNVANLVRATDAVSAPVAPKRSKGDGFHDEMLAGAAWRLLAKNINDSLEAGCKEEVYVRIILEDRTLHRYQVEQVRELFFALRNRVNAVIEKLTTRMAADEPLEFDRFQEPSRELYYAIAEVTPHLIPLIERERERKRRETAMIVGKNAVPDVHAEPNAVD